jgi:sulfopyruvate decarboxylase subunit beta
MLLNVRPKIPQRRFKLALDGDKMTIIVSKCESGNIKVPVIDMDAPVIRHRFMAEVSRRNA